MELVSPFLLLPSSSFIPSPTPNCTLCPKGSFSSGMGESISVCTPCPPGTYSPTEGATACVACALEDPSAVCPVGSASLSYQGYDKEEGEGEKLAPWENPSYEMVLMLSCYLGGLGVGVVVAVILLCLPTKRFLIHGDYYKDRYGTQMDPVTHQAVKYVRQTTLGGFLTVIGFGFLVGALIPVIVMFVRNNVVETQGVVDWALVTSEYTMAEKESDVDVNITLLDFSAECVQSGAGEGECSDILGIGMTKYLLDGFLSLFHSFSLSLFLSLSLSLFLSSSLSSLSFFISLFLFLLLYLITFFFSSFRHQIRDPLWCYRHLCIAPLLQLLLPPHLPL
jgi:hypothetical protein